MSSIPRVVEKSNDKKYYESYKAMAEAIELLDPREVPDLREQLAGSAREAVLEFPTLKANEAFQDAIWPSEGDFTAFFDILRKEDLRSQREFLKKFWGQVFKDEDFPGREGLVSYFVEVNNVKFLDPDPKKIRFRSILQSEVDPAVNTHLEDLKQNRAIVDIVRDTNTALDLRKTTNRYGAQMVIQRFSNEAGRDHAIKVVRYAATQAAKAITHKAAALDEIASDFELDATRGASWVVVNDLMVKANYPRNAYEGSVIKRLWGAGYWPEGSYTKGVSGGRPIEHFVVYAPSLEVVSPLGR